MRKFSRLFLGLVDKFPRLRKGHFLCRVIRLPEGVAKRFDEVRSLPVQNNRRALFKPHGNHRSPPRMHAKSHRRFFHTPLSLVRFGAAVPRLTNPSRKISCITPAARLPQPLSQSPGLSPLVPKKRAVTACHLRFRNARQSHFREATQSACRQRKCLHPTKS